MSLIATLVVAATGLALVLAGVYLLLGLPWALIVGGVALVVTGLFVLPVRPSGDRL